MKRFSAKGAAMVGIGPMELLIVAGCGGLVVLAGVLVLVVVMLAKKKPIDAGAGLKEDLSFYPPAPQAGTHRLLFEGQPVRLRLVVLAPAGRVVMLSADLAEGILQAILHGLGEVADLDKPRVRIWPGQLSQEGFVPK